MIPVAFLQAKPSSTPPHLTATPAASGIPRAVTLLLLLLRLQVAAPAAAGKCRYDGKIFPGEWTERYALIGLNGRGGGL